MPNLDPVTRPARFLRLIEVTGDLSSTLDLDILLNRLALAAADLCAAQAASILLYDEGNEQLYFQAATNLDSGLIRGLVVPVEGSIAGRVLNSRRPIRVSDVEEDPRHYKRIGETTSVQIASLLAVPMITQDKIVGVLEAINKRSGAFTEEDEEVLGALGTQAAVAIINARLFQQSDLIAELVHELHTPLASLNTAAHLLTRPEISADQRTQMAETIFKETQRLSEMTTAFLDIARLESGRSHFEIEELELVALLKEALQAMQGRFDQSGITVELDLPEALPLIQGDADKLKQVALNLLSNAAKYNRPGGKVFVTAQAGDGRLRFSIRDTGRGILPEHMHDLFQKFYRVPGSEQLAPGTGLGLSICKKIVEAHNGVIEADSEVGVGTTFNVYLPLESSLP